MSADREAAIRQMCDAPSDAFSAGEWCEAANDLLAELDAARQEIAEWKLEAAAARQREEEAEARYRAETLISNDYAERLANAEAQLADIRRQMEEARAAGNWPLAKVLEREEKLREAQRAPCGCTYRLELQAGYHTALIVGLHCKNHEPGRRYGIALTPPDQLTIEGEA